MADSKTRSCQKKTAESASVDLLELAMFIQLCPTFLLQIPTEDSLKQTSSASAAMYFYTKDFLKSLNIEQQVHLEEILESFWALVLIFLEEPSILGHARTMNDCLGSNKHKMSESNQLSVFFPLNDWETISHQRGMAVCTRVLRFIVCFPAWILPTATTPGKKHSLQHLNLCFEPLRFGKKNEMTSALREQLTDYLKSYGFATGLCWVICRLKTTGGISIMVFSWKRWFDVYHERN